MRQRRTPTRDLEARRAEEQRMQPRDRLVSSLTLGAEGAQPLARLRIEVERVDG